MKKTLFLAVLLLLTSGFTSEANGDINYYKLFEYRATLIDRETTHNTRLLLTIFFNESKNCITTIYLMDTHFDGRGVFTIPRENQKDLVAMLSKATRWATQADHSDDRFIKLVGTVRIGVNIVFDRRNGVSKILLIDSRFTTDFNNEFNIARKANYIELDPEVAKLLAADIASIDFTSAEKSVKERLQRKTEMENKYN